MKKSWTYLWMVLVLVLTGCEPTLEHPFDRYTINKGKHYATYKAEMLQADFMTFQATFDESAEYVSSSEENQHDINKLFGFADCNAHHHDNSARFGWRWLNGQIDILAYCYVDGERVVEEIGQTMPNTTNNYEIRLTDAHYIFTLDDKTIEIDRSKPCDIGAYYLLYPYFGGDDTAPHDISIYIRRLY